MKTRSRRSKPPGETKKRSSNPAQTAFLALGSNLGNRRRNLERAVRAIASFGKVVAVSSFYETPPEGFENQPDFLNAVLEIETRQQPRELLASAQALEKLLGRTPTFRNGPREIDVDLLDVGGVILRRPGLVLPHPRLHRRRFVLQPLAQIAPRWRHPKLKATASELLARL
jgi:2-amino-4-hydroxy-6-hydroxymethyldihydropteridine diphosphokinase